MNHSGTKQLESKRVILRRFTMDDAQAMFDNWASDPDVTKYLTWPTHSNVEVTRWVLKDWTSQYDNDNFYQWAIVIKENGNVPIGSIGIVKFDDDIQMVHVGYCIGKAWWNQGITSEALGLLIDFFFKEVGVNRIESRYDPRNDNSGKVMKRCGMQFEGTMRQADKNNLGICDYSMYAILRKEYNQCAYYHME